MAKGGYKMKGRKKLLAALLDSSHDSVDGRRMR